MRGGDKDEGEKRCVNIGGRGRFLYTAISLFSLLSNWNEFFEIEILEICPRYSFWFLFFFLFFFFVDNRISEWKRYFFGCSSNKSRFSKI